MLDERTGALLFQLNVLCRGEGYKIVEEQEFTACPSCAADGDDLKNTLAYLKERGYIDVKYAEEGIYCLCVLPDGRLYAERVLHEKTEERQKKRRLFFLSALGAFLGSIAAYFLVFLVTGFGR